MRRYLYVSLATSLLLLMTTSCSPDKPGDEDPGEVGPDATDTAVDGQAEEVDGGPTDDGGGDTEITDTGGDDNDGDTGEAGEDGGETNKRTLADYRRCQTDTDCPVGLGSCIKSVPLNRADEDGTKSVPIRQIFPALKAGQGVCTFVCTNGAGKCSELSVNGSTDDAAPHTCQVVVDGQAPYPASPPSFPFDDQLEANEMAKGQPFGAICRPPFQLDEAVPEAFCSSCQGAGSCSDSSSLCWNSQTGAPAATSEPGTCLSPCADDGECPLGFQCDAEDGMGQNYCRPVLDTCTKCRDRDGDGVGTGLCRESADQVTAYDCDDRNANAYYDPDDLEHPFPKFCGTQDYNCNGLSDADEQIGAAQYPAAHCTACQDSCSGSVPNGKAQCQSVGNSGSFCLPECQDVDGDSKPDFADCDGNLSNGCEVRVDDPSRIFYRDADKDGYGDPNDAKFACNASTAPAGYVANNDDCNDNAVQVYGGANPATEVCDGLDNDCDGDIDANDSDLTKAGSSCQSNNPGVCRPGTWLCQGKQGWLCEPNIKPGDRTETCGDSKDNDCDGEVDEQWDKSGQPDAAYSYTEFFPDGDGDGYGKNMALMMSASVWACSQPANYAARRGDCDDGNAQIHEDRDELCSTPFDDNCDGKTNDPSATDATTWYHDGDGDSWGADNDTQKSCPKPKDHVKRGGDCNDQSSDVNPGENEDCDTAFDDDCNNKSNEEDAANATTFYKDGDGDQFGQPGSGRNFCSAKGDHTATKARDCDDSDFKINPNGTEVCNGKDDDCDGSTDEGCPAYYNRLTGSISYKGRIGPSSGGSSGTANCSADRVWTTASLAYYKGSWPVQEVDVGCEDLVNIEQKTSPRYSYDLQTANHSFPSGNWGNDARTHDSQGSPQSGSTRSHFSCGEGEAIYKVEAWDDGGWLVRIKLYCREYMQGSGTTASITTGSSSTTTRGFGNVAGTKHTSTCGNDQVAVGLKAWSDNYYSGSYADYYNTLTGVELLCRKIETRRQ